MIKTFLLLIQGRFLMSSSNLGSKNTELRNPEFVFEDTLNLYLRRYLDRETDTKVNKSHVSY